LATAGELLPARGCDPQSVLGDQGSGSREHPSTPLQRLQVIKGWVHPTTGQASEKVYELAGDPNDGAKRRSDFVRAVPGLGAMSCAPSGRTPTSAPASAPFTAAG
jgi:hypothetical protein